MNNYYYLVSGLPDLAMDDIKRVPFSFLSFVQEISDQVAPEDKELIRLFRHTYDNKNVIALLEKKEEELDPRGFFTREELEQEVKVPANLPCYLKTFLDAYIHDKQLFPELVLEDQLTWLFYDQMTAHSNDFIREWFSFERNMRNVLAGLNMRALLNKDKSLSDVFSLGSVLIGRNDVVDAIQKSSASDFSLSAQHPWGEKIVAHQADELVEFERNLDMIRWDYVNELITFSYFQIETILAFGIKLAIVERWQHLDPEIGRERLTQCIAELQSGFSISEEL